MHWLIIHHPVDRPTLGPLRAPSGPRLFTALINDSLSSALLGSARCWSQMGSAILHWRQIYGESPQVHPSRLITKSIYKLCLRDNWNGWGEIKYGWIGEFDHICQHFIRGERWKIWKMNCRARQHWKGIEEDYNLTVKNIHKEKGHLFSLS